MSSGGVHSDQMTISSPISHEMINVTYPKPALNPKPAEHGLQMRQQKWNEKERALKKVINSDIAKGLRNLTQSI